MAETTINAGAKLDVLNRKELREELKHGLTAWRSEVAQGDRYLRRSAFGTVLADGTLEIGLEAGAGGDETGPGNGYLWSVRRLNVVERDPDDVTWWRLCVNSTQFSDTVCNLLTSYQSFSDGELVLYPGDRLVVAGEQLNTGDAYRVTFGVREVPVSLAWRIGA